MKFYKPKCGDTCVWIYTRISMYIHIKTHIKEVCVYIQSYRLHQHTYKDITTNVHTVILFLTLLSSSYCIRRIEDQRKIKLPTTSPLSNAKVWGFLIVHLEPRASLGAGRVLTELQEHQIIT